MPFMKKIDPPHNLTALAYNSIKAYVLREDLDEETRLTEEFLSSQLGISKSPVREALNSLHTEGLIRIEARRGAFLRRFSIQEVKDLYNLREVLEVYAVGVATINSEVILELRRSTERARKHLKSNNKLGHIEEDTKFHALIAAATGNAELCRVLANVQSQLWLCRRKTYDLSSSTLLDAHQAITEALEKGNRPKAQTAMHNHIDLVRQRLICFMEKEPPSVSERFQRFG
jgi:DNA-binding GntR family transcriptional regulator